VQHYYYEVSVCIILDENRQQFFTPEKYHAVKESPEYKNLQIERIEYAVWYYEAFHNKYRGWAGNPTGKCFSLLKLFQNFSFERETFKIGSFVGHKPKNCTSLVKTNRVLKEAAI
jgi:hypothetical protein